MIFFFFQLKDLTESALVCLIPLLSPEEGLIQVVNSELLPSEIRFAVSTSTNSNKSI